MDRTAAIAELPEARAAALGLRDAGLTDELGLDDQAIAARLGIEFEAVDPLLRLAAVASSRPINRHDPKQRPATLADPR
jgi:hypothetical protein